MAISLSFKGLPPLNSVQGIEAAGVTEMGVVQSQRNRLGIHQIGRIVPRPLPTCSLAARQASLADMISMAFNRSSKRKIWPVPVADVSCARGCFD